ncbi:MAG: hypothetical protein WD069_13610 [Planctomycetales bacterium]
MPRRLSLLLVLILLGPAAGCQLMGPSPKPGWNPFRTASDEVLPEPAVAEDDWTSFAGQARGKRPPKEEKRKSRLKAWFSRFEDPRPGEINRNLGYE